MTTNLNLPICPKCNDTKHVSGCVFITNPPWYVCTACQIEWSGNKHGGQIRDLTYFAPLETKESLIHGST